MKKCLGYLVLLVVAIATWIVVFYFAFQGRAQ